MAGIRKAGIRLPAGPLFTALTLAEVEYMTLSPRHRRAWDKAKIRGFFTLDMADEISCKVLKQHPLMIWGVEYASLVWHDMHDDDPTDPAPAVVVPINVKRNRPRNYTYMGTEVMAA